MNIGNVIRVIEHFGRQPILISLEVLILALLLGLGRSFGIPSLVKHPRALVRIFNGFALGVLLCWIAFIAHIVDWSDWTRDTRGLQLLASDAGVTPHIVYFLFYGFVTLLVCLPISVLVVVMESDPRTDTPHRSSSSGHEGSNSQQRAIESDNKSKSLTPRSWMRGGHPAVVWGVLMIGLVAAIIASSVTVEWGARRLELVGTSPPLMGQRLPVERSWVPGDSKGKAPPRAGIGKLHPVAMLGVTLLAVVVATTILLQYMPRRSSRLFRWLPPVVVFGLAVGGLVAVVDVTKLVIQALIATGLFETLGKDQVPAWMASPTGLTNLAIAAAVVCLTLIAGFRRYRVCLPATRPRTGSEAVSTALDGWEPLYANPRPIDSPSTPVRPSEDIAFPGDDGRSQRPVVVVAASGGGITAAVWTLAVLSELQTRANARAETEEASGIIRWMSGASGGMLGAAYFATLLAERRSTAVDWTRAIEAISKDCLSSTVRTFAFHDLLWSLLPCRSRFERGQALELAWSENLGGLLDTPLSQLRDAERTGRSPSLVFSPMLVEDGRRLLISNLDFGWLHAAQPRSFVEFYKVFPEGRHLLSVATAARMSATFPLISPAVILPTAPRRRVVDAGYFDNYGVHLAAAWVRELHRQKGKDTPPVVFVEIRAFPRLEPRESSWFARGWEDLATPLHGLGTARKAVNAYRNDELVTHLEDCLGSRFKRLVFECPAGLPLSWFLTPNHLDRIVSGLNQQSQAFEEFEQRLDMPAQSADPPNVIPHREELTTRS